MIAKVLIFGVHGLLDGQRFTEAISIYFTFLKLFFLMSWFVREQVQACHFLCTLSAAVQFRTRLQVDVNEEFICFALLNFVRVFFLFFWWWEDGWEAEKKG